MANSEHGKLAKQGGEAWNKWREEHGESVPDISGEQLHRVDLKGADLSEVNMFETLLTEADFSGANLQNANMEEANLTHTNLKRANLRNSKMNGANLQDILNWADIKSINQANLSGVVNPPDGFLEWVKENGAIVDGSDGG